MIVNVEIPLSLEYKEYEIMLEIRNNMRIDNDYQVNTIKKYPER